MWPGSEMLSMLESRSSCLDSSPGLDHCVMFRSKTLHSHSASDSLLRSLVYDFYQQI